MITITLERMFRSTLSAIVARAQRRRQHRKALRELEQMDRNALSDLGLSRRDLVTRCFGVSAGAGAAFD